MSERERRVFRFDDRPPSKKVRARKIHISVCQKCEVEMVRCDWGYVCRGCGACLSVFDAPPAFVENIWLRVRSSSYSRTKHFESAVTKLVHQNYVGALCYDFTQVVRAIERVRQDRSNISRYSFYIIRLCSRRGIPVEAQDIKSEKRVMELEQELFGVIYPMLGWDRGRCGYYLRWKSRE